jgi:hypothetical protein
MWVTLLNIYREERCCTAGLGIDSTVPNSLHNKCACPVQKQTGFFRLV